MRVSKIANLVNAPVIHNHFSGYFAYVVVIREEKRREEKRREEKRRDETLPRAAIINFGANPIRGVSWCVGALGLNVGGPS